MGKIAFVFAGQGAQYPGMGKEICESCHSALMVFNLAEGLRPGTVAQCFSGDKEELNLTVNTQPCLFATDLAIAAALEEAGLKADGVAGFSLGEIPALTFAGVFSVDEGFSLVMNRGQFMHEEGEKTPGGMYAVLKLSPEQVEALCAQFPNVYPANFNSAAQTVVAYSGDGKPFAAAVKAEKGLAMPLAVSGAFHTPIMANASQRLQEVLKEMVAEPARIPVYANLTARPYPDGEAEIKDLVARQVISPVRWQITIENMKADGFDTFIEVGPGKTLTGLIQKIYPEAKCYHVETASDMKDVLQNFQLEPELSGKE